MEQRQLNVDVIHCRDEDIWIATSDGILGMVVESQGIAEFLSDVVDVATQLLEINEQINADQLEMTRLCLHVKQEPDVSSVMEDRDTLELQPTELQLATASSDTLVSLYRDVTRALKTYGWAFYRQAVGSYEIWRSLKTRIHRRSVCLRISVKASLPRAS